MTLEQKATMAALIVADSARERTSAAFQRAYRDDPDSALGAPYAAWQAAAATWWVAWKAAYQAYGRNGAA